jgi:ornithine cyclodeaminase/alanine dehydrogenase-like protein (mu-crystallin family)
LREATLGAHVIVTCTTARAPFLNVGDVSPGVFIAAVGADNPEKSEMAPALMAEASVVADVLAQCAVMGDLHHAIAAGAMTADRVRAELGDVVVGTKRGRSRDDEIVIFDSTGTAIQDVASAAIVYERARERGVGMVVELA